MRIAVLGAGMSGLVAAKALLDMNYDFNIFDKCESNVSQQVGLHYLHNDLGLELEPHKLQNLIVRDSKQADSDARTYSRKIWGNDSVLDNSLRDLLAYTTVYDFREAFELLNIVFKPSVIKLDISPGHIAVLKTKYDLIISTIPLPILYPYVLCESETMWAINNMPDIKIDDFTVIYNLKSNDSWYRTSMVFGQPFTEYIKQVPGAFPIKKIKTANVNIYQTMFSDHVLLVGRFGCWDRHKLVHHIYNDVKEGVHLYEQQLRSKHM